MLKVDINTSFVDEATTGNASIALERRRGETWNRETVIDFTPGTSDATRTLILENDQRLVLSGDFTVEMTYDKEQFVHTPKPHDDAPPVVTLPPKVATASPSVTPAIFQPEPTVVAPQTVVIEPKG